MIPGYVYVLSNNSLFGVVKVGVSINSPQEVAINNFANEFIPDDFIVEYYSKFDNIYEAEFVMRNKLNIFHYKKDFYKVDKEIVIKIIQDIDLKKNEIFLNKHEKNIIKLTNEFIINKQKNENLKVFYSELKKLKKSIKNFPLKSKSYLIYSTYHIEENYRSLLDAYKKICINDYDATKQKKEISLVYDKMVNCIKLKNQNYNKYVKIE